MAPCNWCCGRCRQTWCGCSGRWCGGERVEIGRWARVQAVVALPGAVRHVEVLEVLQILEELLVVEGDGREGPFATEEADRPAPTHGEWWCAFVGYWEDFFALGVLHVVATRDGGWQGYGGHVAVLALCQWLCGCGRRQVAHSSRGKANELKWWNWIVWKGERGSMKFGRFCHFLFCLKCFFVSFCLI